MFAPRTPPPGMMFILVVICFCIMLSGCGGPGVVGGLSGKDTIRIINATRHLSKDGIVANMYDCAYDALDTNNRGSGCHRSK